MHIFAAALVVTTMVALVYSNAHMVKPMAFLAPESEIPWDRRDYDIDDSLFLNGTNYPCKGYQHSPLAQVSETLKAGESNTLEITVGASHDGGTCELSLSYDNGITFRVFKRFIGGCPLSSSQWTSDYIIPEYAPSGKKVIFSWTWLAYTSMEMWQSCAFVEIQGIPSKENAAKFRALPPVWRGSLYEFSDTCVSKDRYHLIPPLTDGVEIEYSSDANGVIPSPENYPYTFYPGQCDNDKQIASSWAYDIMNGMNKADCNLAPMIPCSAKTGWPSRGSYEQACTRSSPPVGWKQFPIECGGQGPVTEDEYLVSSFLMDQVVLH